MKILILTHQCFEITKIKSARPKDVNIQDLDFYLWEHPQYFTNYNFNKKKLVLHRATLKYYEAYLKSKKVKSITYLDYQIKDTKFLKTLKMGKDEEYLVFDPIDKIKLPGKYTYLESPNFLLTKNDYLEYRQKTDKFLFNNF